MLKEIDKQGFPVLLSTIRDPDTKSGNPYHSKLTGEFTNAPAGVAVLKGEELLKLMSPGTKKILADRARIGKANQMAAEIIDGKLHIVLLRDGKRIHSFSVLPRKNKGEGQEENGEGNQPLQITPIITDAIIEAARNLGLTDQGIISQIEKQTGIEFSDNQRAELLQQVKDKRLEDLIAYLDYQLRQRTSDLPKEDAIIRIAVGRGFFRRTFAGLDEPTTKIVLDRLRAKGWGDEVLQAAVISKFPKRLKTVFTIEHKRTQGKEQIEQQQKSRTRERI